MDQDIRNQDILNQCLAGIQSHCTDPNNFQNCKRLYEETFRESVYNGIETCAPWNSGRKSDACMKIASVVKSRFVKEEELYKKNFVDFVQNDLFSNAELAPCYPRTQCKYD